MVLEDFFFKVFSKKRSMKDIDPWGVAILTPLA